MLRRNHTRNCNHSHPRSAKALSKYTDAVDAAVREALDKLAAATDAARVALRQVGPRGAACYAPTIRGRWR